MVVSRRVSGRFSALVLVLGLVGCAEERPDLANTMAARAGLPNQLLEVNQTILERRQYNPDRNAYFGDLHVHTGYSFDAYAFGTIATPYDAYRYARGEAIDHPAGYQVQLRQPLDFYAVTDHAMFMGLLKEAANTDTDFSRTEVAQPLHNLNAPDNYGTFSFFERSRIFATFLPAVLADLVDGTLDQKQLEPVTRSAWADSINAADQFYQPGEFTTFAAYEYTSSTDEMGNLHRNVVFRGTERLPAVPFSRFHSQNPEGLWDWMDGLREQGIESLSIPHNSNGSNGAMFALEDWAGDPMDDSYADQRMRNEPLVEITQVKGTSDTHPLLSPNDEWADFEIYKFRVGTSLHSEEKGSYVREALRSGLALEAQGVKNPYQFGFVAASDTHVAGTSDDEETYFSKAGLLDGLPERRGSVPVDTLYGLFARFLAPDTLTEVDGRTYTYGGGFESWSASGVTGVWACLLYTSPSPRDLSTSRMPSSA